jgi:hypothetical protein
MIVITKEAFRNPYSVSVVKKDLIIFDTQAFPSFRFKYYTKEGSEEGKWTENFQNDIELILYLKKLLQNEKRRGEKKKKSA